uniref:Uncharacterized protein n=1 Tax=uncultured marine virus TaxID=186617 RepID=A0A0F7L7Q2_9VIRU|nr:hypothetical protein [uncultured marine virus]
MLFLLELVTLQQWQLHQKPYLELTFLAKLSTVLIVTETPSRVDSMSAICSPTVVSIKFRATRDCRTATANTCQNLTLPPISFNLLIIFFI